MGRYCVQSGVSSSWYVSNAAANNGAAAMTHKSHHTRGARRKSRYGIHTIATARTKLRTRLAAWLPNHSTVVGVGPFHARMKARSARYPPGSDTTQATLR